MRSYVLCAIVMCDVCIPCLQEGLDNVSEKPLLIGATNRPADIDSAILRRLSKRIFVPLPDLEVS